MHRKLRENERKEEQKKDKELKKRKADDEKMAEQVKEFNGCLNNSHEQFLLEIEEYAKKLNKDSDSDEQRDTTDSSQEEQELEIDNLHQVIDDLKLQLEAEKNKVNDLNEIILNKDQLIKSLEDDTNTDRRDKEGHKQYKCRYWNRGFCREGSKCLYVHPSKDCKTYVTEGSCEDRKCEGRHRRYCRYFNNTSGCYRGDTCQYLHSSSKKEEMNNLSKRTECDKDMQEILRCNHCDFKTQQKVTLQKHIHTKHKESS